MNADKRPSAAYSSPRGATAGSLPGSKKSLTHNVRPVGKVGARSSILQMSKTAIAGGASKTGTPTAAGKGFLGCASSLHKGVDEASTDNGIIGSSPPPGSKSSRVVAFEVCLDPLGKVSEESADAVLPPAVVPRQSSAACVKVPGSRLPIPNLLGRRNSEERGDAQKSPAVSQTSLKSTSSAKSNGSVTAFEFPAPAQSTLLAGILESIAEDNELVDKFPDKMIAVDNLVMGNKNSKAKRTPSINVQPKSNLHPNKGRQSVTSAKPVAFNNNATVTSQTKIKLAPSSQYKSLAQRGSSYASVVTAASATTPLAPLAAQATLTQDYSKTSAISPVAVVQPVCTDVILNKSTLSHSNTNKANKLNKVSGSLQTNVPKQQPLAAIRKTAATLGTPPKNNKVNMKVTQKTMPVGKQKISPPTAVTVAKVEVAKKESIKMEPVLDLVEPMMKVSNAPKVPTFGAKQHSKKDFTKMPKVAALRQEETLKTTTLSSLLQDEPKLPKASNTLESSPKSSLPTLELLTEEFPTIPKSSTFLQEGIPLVLAPQIVQLMEKELKPVCVENDCQTDKVVEELTEVKPVCLESDCQTDEIVEKIVETKPLCMENDCQTDEVVKEIIETKETLSQTEKLVNVPMDTQTPIFTFSEAETQAEDTILFDSETQTPTCIVTTTEVQTVFRLSSNSETQTPSVESTEAESQTCIAIMLPMDVQATEVMTEAETEMLPLYISENESQTAELEIANVESQTSQQHLMSVESQTSHLRIATVESQTSQLQIATIETQTAIVPKILQVDTPTSMEVDIVQPSMSFLSVFFLSLVYRVWLRMQVRSLIYSRSHVALQLMDVETDVLELPAPVSSLPFVPGADVSEEDTIISGGAAQLMCSPSTVIFHESGLYSLDDACSSELLQTVAENLESLSSVMAEWSSERLLSQESTVEMPHPLLPDSEELMRWWHPKIPTRFDYMFSTNAEYTCNENEDSSSLFDAVDNHCCNNTTPVVEIAGHSITLELPETEDDSPSIDTAVMSYHSITMLDAQESEMHETGGVKTCDEKLETEDEEETSVQLETETVMSSTSFYCEDAVGDMEALEKPNVDSVEDMKDGIMTGERSDEIMVSDSLNIDLSFLDCVEETATKSCRSVESVRSDSILFADADEYLEDVEKDSSNVQQITESCEKDEKGRVDDECGDNA